MKDGEFGGGASKKRDSKDEFWDDRKETKEEGIGRGFGVRRIDVVFLDEFATDEKSGVFTLAIVE